MIFKFCLSRKIISRKIITKLSTAYAFRRLARRGLKVSSPSESNQTLLLNNESLHKDDDLDMEKELQKLNDRYR